MFIYPTTRSHDNSLCIDFSKFIIFVIRHIHGFRRVMDINNITAQSQSNFIFLTIKIIKVDWIIHNIFKVVFSCYCAWYKQLNKMSCKAIISTRKTMPIKRVNRCIRIKTIHPKLFCYVCRHNITSHSTSASENWISKSSNRDI